MHESALLLPDSHPLPLPCRSAAIIAARQRVPILHVFLQPRPKIASTLEAHHDRRDQQRHGKSTKNSQHPPRRPIRSRRLALEDLAQLVHEVSDSDEVRHDDQDLAFAALVLDDPYCEQKKRHGEGDGADGEIELCLANLQPLRTGDYGEKLHREAKEEEEVELQQCDIELHRQ